MIDKCCVVCHFSYHTLTLYHCALSVAESYGPSLFGCIPAGQSFLRSTSATKKTAEKILALLVVLPTVLRHYIRQLRRGICLLVLALRMLEGQVHSYNECRRLGVEPRSRCLDKRLLPMIGWVVWWVSECGGGGTCASVSVVGGLLTHIMS